MGSWVWKQRLMNREVNFKVASAVTETQTALETLGKEENDCAGRICLLDIFTNLQTLYHCHQGEKGPALSKQESCLMAYFERQGYLLDVITVNSSYLAF